MMELISIPPQIIEFIDIIKGTRAVAFGSGAAGGVVMVYTKRGPLNILPEHGSLKTSINGYHRVREFSVFDPNLPDNRNRPDYRTTLHWNADLRTNSKGLVKEQLLTSDQTGKFFIIAQGLRDDGMPFFGTGTFFVE